MNDSSFTFDTFGVPTLEEFRVFSPACILPPIGSLS